MPGPAAAPASDALAGVVTLADPAAFRRGVGRLNLSPLDNFAQSHGTAIARPLARIRRGVRRTRGAISTSMRDRAPNTDTGEPETSSDALLDELVRALARQAAERDYEALRNKTRSAHRPSGGKKDSR